MSNALVIVESPVKARLVARYAQPVLGKDTQVHACFGHLRDLSEGELAVDVERGFLPRYIIQPKRTGLVGELRTMICAASQIYLATDPDREGEAVAWHICQVFKPELKDKQIWRVSFNEVTERAVQKALKNPRRLDIRLVQAAVARRVMDRLVGYIISPILWKHVRGKDLSAGRVQTAALRILAEAEMHTTTTVEIEL